MMNPLSESFMHPLAVYTVVYAVTMMCVYIFYRKGFYKERKQKVAVVVLAVVSPILFVAILLLLG